MNLTEHDPAHSAMVVRVLRVASSPPMSLTNATTGSIVPLMVSRLILSLKKTANSPSTVWSTGQVSLGASSLPGVPSVEPSVGVMSLCDLSLEGGGPSQGYDQTLHRIPYVSPAGLWWSSYGSWETTYPSDRFHLFFPCVGSRASIV